jgi:Beta/Gamma crystallin
MPAGDHIIIFEHLNFRGRHRHIIVEEADLNHPDDNTLNDRVSSWVILVGNWEFFRNPGFTGGYTVPNRVFPPGDYPLGNPAITNDTISSLRSV